MSVVVIDDCVDKETQDLIENTVFSQNTQWTFGRTVFSHSDPNLTEQAKKYGMNFTKSLYRSDDNYACDELELYLQPLINVGLTALLTARLQLQLPVVSDKEYGMPHLDGIRDFKYKVAVYYVNDSDGDTVLFKERKEDVPPSNLNAGFNIDRTINPKKGRLIIFDGDIYHSAGKPKNDVRSIINYNFI